MKKIAKKEVKSIVENAIAQALRKLSVVTPSKETKKAITKVAKKISLDVKKQAKQDLKKSKPSKQKKTPVKKAKTN